MDHSLWQRCLSVLREELPAQQFSMWIRPLQSEVADNILTLYAPNRFVLDWVRDKYVNRINELVSLQEPNNPPLLRFDVGSKPKTLARTTTSALDIHNNMLQAWESLSKSDDVNFIKTNQIRHFGAYINIKHENNAIEYQMDKIVIVLILSLVLFVICLNRLWSSWTRHIMKPPQKRKTRKQGQKYF